MARILVVDGEVFDHMDQPDQAKQKWTEAKDLLLEHNTEELPFARLGTLVYVMHLLDQQEIATIHRQRLERAGYVPLSPYP